MYNSGDELGLLVIEKGLITESEFEGGVSGFDPTMIELLTVKPASSKERIYLSEVVGKAMKQGLINLFLCLVCVSACAPGPFVRSEIEVALEEYQEFDRDYTIWEYLTGGGFDRSMFEEGAGIGD
jgi:hypothetical protein